MGWFGPRGDCGCCGDFVCRCNDDPNVLGRKFSGEVAIKTVISGLPSFLEWTDINTSSGPTAYTYRIYRLNGLDQANGTYFLPLLVNDLGCITQQESPVFETFDLTLDRFALDHEDPLFFPACSWETTEIFDGDFEPLLHFTMGWSSLPTGFSQLSTETRSGTNIFGEPISGEMQLFARTVLQCSRDYDINRTVGTAVPWLGGPDYPLSSGQIWITGPNRQDCGGSALSMIVGSIFSEIVEL